MSLNDLPVSEAIGVFVGVAGFDLLAEGQANPLKALLCALAVGFLVFLVRRRSDRQE